MLSHVLAPAHVGIEGQVINVECDLSNGLPSFIVVGLPDKAIEEAKERVRSALKHSNLQVPTKRITLNLAPADLPKDGSAFDLPMAMAILAASGQVQIDSRSMLFAGELALDGTLRAIPGVLSYALLARSRGIRQLYIPADNAKQAAVISDVQVFPVKNLFQLYRHLLGDELITTQKINDLQLVQANATTNLSHIYGQEQAKRAVEIAAAGNHNILMSGPPGSGKTMLSKALIGLLPPPSFEETIEITQLHSLAGTIIEGIMTTRPFRAPHHTASAVALIGGGRVPRPGEISLSHNGVLFLDELPEFPRSVLEVLRQPLEDGCVTVSRASGTITFPAKFLLVATQNPCPCGYAGDVSQNCSCTPAQVARYHQRVSGPLIDRIDLVVDVAKVDHTKLVNANADSESSSAVAERVREARLVQQDRLGSSCRSNADLTNDEIKAYCRLDNESSVLARQAIASLNLSARAYMRSLKVARTIADLAASPTISPTHFAEAISYRIRA